MLCILGQRQRRWPDLKAKALSKLTKVCQLVTLKVVHKFSLQVKG